MRIAGVVCLAGLLVMGAAVAAEDLTSGIEAGGSVPTYEATKCSAADEGIQWGQSLCFT